MLRPTVWLLVAIVLGVYPYSAFAQGFPLSSLCNLISSQMKDPDPSSDFLYMYQKVIYQAAGVTPGGDRNDVKKKVNQLWVQIGAVKCNSPEFSVQNGSLLKFAVAQNFASFIEDATMVWRIAPEHLNRRDASDGKNVLEYVDERIQSNRGGLLERDFRRYRELLVRAGASR